MKLLNRIIVYNVSFFKKLFVAIGGEFELVSVNNTQCVELPFSKIEIIIYRSSHLA